ncbi:hypothetical protein [Amorphus sp. MBR-141]
MRALQRVGDVASVTVDGALRTGRITAIDARDASLVLADGQTVTRPRAALKAVRPVRKTALRRHRHVQRAEPDLVWSRGPGKRRAGWR